MKRFILFVFAIFILFIMLMFYDDITSANIINKTYTPNENSNNRQSKTSNKRNPLAQTLLTQIQPDHFGDYHHYTYDTLASNLGQDNNSYQSNNGLNYSKNGVLNANEKLIMNQNEFNLKIKKLKGDNNELNFLILGDYGYFENNEEVKPSTRKLADYVIEKASTGFKKYDFILSVGDNIYDEGINSIKDHRLITLINDTFKATQLGLDWYSVLGNRDCSGNVQATLNMNALLPQWKQTQSYYHKIFPIGNSSKKVLFMFLNGCELACKNKFSTECFESMWKNIDFANIDNQLIWMNHTLSILNNDHNIIWKLVIVHWPIFSAGSNHGDNDALKEQLLPILTKYNIDLVLSGHDHNVQYLRADLKQLDNKVKKEKSSNDNVTTIAESAKEQTQIPNPANNDTVIEKIDNTTVIIANINDTTTPIPDSDSTGNESTNLMTNNSEVSQKNISTPMNSNDTNDKTSTVDDDDVISIMDNNTIGDKNDSESYISVKNAEQENIVVNNQSDILEMNSTTNVTNSDKIDNIDLQGSNGTIQTQNNINSTADSLNNNITINDKSNNQEANIPANMSTNGSALNQTSSNLDLKSDLSNDRLLLDMKTLERHGDKTLIDSHTNDNNQSQQSQKLDELQKTQNISNPTNNTLIGAINQCEEEIDYNYCQFDEFFSHELTKCGVIKNSDYLRSIYDENYMESKKIFDSSQLYRESIVKKYEYLHQIVIGNGGLDLEPICVLKHGRSKGKLKYGNCVVGLGEAKITEESLEIVLLSVEGELLYKLTLLNNDTNPSNNGTFI